MAEPHQHDAGWTTSFSNHLNWVNDTLLPPFRLLVQGNGNGLPVSWYCQFGGLGGKSGKAADYEAGKTATEQALLEVVRRMSNLSVGERRGLEVLADGGRLTKTLGPAKPNPSDDPLAHMLTPYVSEVTRGLVDRDGKFVEGYGRDFHTLVSDLGLCDHAPTICAFLAVFQQNMSHVETPAIDEPDEPTGAMRMG